MSNRNFDGDVYLLTCAVCLPARVTSSLLRQIPRCLNISSRVLDSNQRRPLLGYIEVTSLVCTTTKLRFTAVVEYPRRVATPFTEKNSNMRLRVSGPLIRVSVLLLIVASFAAPALAQKRNITEKDLFNFVWIGDPQLSPDGSRVAFVRVTVNDKKDSYNTAIWTVETASGETRQLTNGPRDTTPRWSPDGKYLLFVRAGELSVASKLALYSFQLR